MKKISILFYLTLFIWFAPQIHADSSSFLNLEKGVVKISRNKIILIYKKAGLKIPIFNLDQIHTGKDTFATLKLAGKDDIDLYPRSVIKISMDEKQANEIRMPVGKALFNIKKRKKIRRRLKIRTSNAIIGIKGTKFIVATSEQTTNLITLSGIVTLANIDLPDIVAEVIENHASQIKQNLPPTEPNPVPPDIRNKIISDETIKSFSAVTFRQTIGELEGEDKVKDIKEEQEKQDDNTNIEGVIDNIDEIKEDLQNEDIEEKIIEFKIIH